MKILDVLFEFRNLDVVGSADQVLEVYFGSVGLHATSLVFNMFLGNGNASTTLFRSSFGVLLRYGDTTTHLSIDLLLFFVFFLFLLLNDVSYGLI